MSPIFALRRRTFAVGGVVLAALAGCAGEIDPSAHRARLPLAPVASAPAYRSAQAANP